MPVHLLPLVLALVLGTGFLLWDGTRRWRKARLLLRSGIGGADRLTGSGFEDLLAALFEAEGYAVRKVGRTGDFGGDLLLERGGVRTVVQAKRYRGRVGVRAVQEAVAAKGYYRCGRAWVATNSRFTRAAAELAWANGVLLLDRDGLAQRLLAARTLPPPS